MSKLPSDTEIKALHKKYATSERIFHDTYEHCQVVASIAHQLLKNRPEITVDTELVRVGCLLHDIGVYRLYKGEVIDQQNYIRHGILGEELLRAEGLDSRLCEIASHHTGVGIDKADIIRLKLPLPEIDFTPTTLEQKLVAYADKFHSKASHEHPQVFNSTSWYRNYVSRLGESKPFAFDALISLFGEPELGSIMRDFGYSNDLLRDI